jgi:CHAD domain-containing protein
MDNPHREYRIPDGLPVEALKSHLSALRPLGEEPPRVLRRTLLDTFDWRVWQAGALLEAIADEGGLRLRWRWLERDAPALEQDAPAEGIGFARDLPPGPVRDEAAAAAGIRRLLPVLELNTEVRTLCLRNDDDKTVVRLRHQAARVRGASGAPEVALAPRLTLLPLKGYEDELAEVRALLEDGLGLAPAEAPLMVEALERSGRRPGDYSSKLDYRLDPGERADAAARRILLGLLDTLEANVPGTRANLDPEFLHDLRVATRRTRSALGQIKGVFPPAVVEDFKARFAWLQQVTGPLRDLDVYLLGFEGYRAALPAPLRPHLDPLRAYLRAHYDEAQAALARELESDTFDRLLRDWGGFLTSPLPLDPEAPSAMRPAKALADERIWRMVRRVRREGRAITLESPAAEMHELRKSCKKLRYLMEFFQSLYPPGAVAGAIKLMKRLLDNLGDFQDLAVQADHLSAIARDMDRESRVDPDTLLAMGALVGDLYRRQQAARADFAALFAQFDGDDNRALLRDLFRPDPAAEEAS